MSEDIDIESAPNKQPRSAGWLVSVIGSVAVLAVAGAATAVTFMTEPVAQREGATKKSSMLVDVVEVQPGSYAPQITATGTVIAEKEVMLEPQVSGRVTWVSEAFSPGGFVEKGEVLLRLENTDYAFQVSQRKAELSDVMSALALEQGLQRMARTEAAYVEEDLSEEDRALVLRAPQIAAAEQKVVAAKAAVAQARVELDRTVIKAPFSAHVISRSINIGSQVSTNDRLGHLVGIEKYWIEVELPLNKRRWVNIPKDGNGSEVTVRNRTAWMPEQTRTGHLTGSIGALNQQTRMARVIATIEDPLARDEANRDQPPLTIGEYLEVTIAGREMKDVFRLERDHVRANDVVWIKQDGKLKITPVEVLFRDVRYAYITKGLNAGDAVVVTSLSRVVDGADLQLRKDGNE